jgi:hypothetical protein
MIIILIIKKSPEIGPGVDSTEDGVAMQVQ